MQFLSNHFELLLLVCFTGSHLLVDFRCFIECTLFRYVASVGTSEVAFHRKWSDEVLVRSRIRVECLPFITALHENKRPFCHFLEATLNRTHQLGLAFRWFLLAYFFTQDLLPVDRLFGAFTDFRLALSLLLGQL